MCEVLVAWETLDLADQPPFIREYAGIWRAVDKIGYSKTLQTVSGARTRIERAFDPEAVRQMKASAGSDLSVGGPDSPLRRSGPTSSTSTTSSSHPSRREAARGALPDRVRVTLELVDERRFANGVVHLQYRTKA